MDRLREPFDPSVEEGPDGAYLRSMQFENLSSAAEVRAVANDLLRLLNGTHTLEGASKRATFPGSVQVDAEGRRHITAFLGGVSAMSFAGSLGVASTQLGGPSKTQNWAQLSPANANLREALTYFGGEDSWYDLYKCIESLEDWAGGEAKLNTKPYVNPGYLKRAKRTANTHRHAASKYRANGEPTPFNEARALVADILRRALREVEGDA